MRLTKTMPPIVIPDKVFIEERAFVETDGAGTYTAEVAIPVGARVLDVRWNNTALWTAVTSATLNVGDSDDPDGYFSAIDLKTGPAIDVNGAGGMSAIIGAATEAGAYKGLSKKYDAGGSITATIVTVGGTGDAGNSALTVLYCVPTIDNAIKA